MKTIGLIGGISWESSAHYYEIINKETNRILGGHHFAKCVLYSIDFADIVTYQNNNQWDKCSEILCDAAKKLELAGADFIGLCTNTSHKAADEIQNVINIPFYHIAELTADKLIEDEIKCVGLLGTKFTMEEDFYKQKLIDRGLEVLVPNKSDIKIINDSIFNELCYGIVDEQRKKDFIRIINELKDKGAEGIILGCTELNMIVNPENVTIKLYDTTDIHAKKLVEIALAKDKL